jgi:RNA polymerase sigma-70 factor, ECF subfamily
MNALERIQREQYLRRAVLAGDERAWQLWYDASFEPLARYVRWRCSSRRELIDEVLQEVWLTAVRRIRDFDPSQGSFIDWLHGIAALQLKSHFRRYQRHEQRRESVETDELAAAETPDQTLDVAAALASLSDRHEAVLRAKYLDGLSVAEIAINWNESPKAIESLLTRAREAFRQLHGWLSPKN